MTGTISKWGNSQAIRLPKAVLELAFLKENDSVQISVVNERIIIKRAVKQINPSQKRKTLKQRVEEFYGKDFESVLAENPYEFNEINSGPRVGAEVW